MNLLKKLFTGLLLSAVIISADAISAKPLRYGPVQYYGALGTSGSKIVGAKNNKQVMLRGMSLYWSDATGMQYYNDAVIKYATQTLGIDVFRYAMGIQYYKSDGSASEPLDENYSYMGNPTGSLGSIDRMVKAAIENDVYIIIDWHSHRAENEQSAALEFFTTVAQKYKDIPNVIFEIYNEPVNTGWSAIQSYANVIIPAIRQHTQNLVLVGTPRWSQLGSYGGLTQTNIAYVFHFYAAEHSVSSFSSNITGALNSGNAVFISEWGTTKADGKTSPSESATNEWLQFMESNKLSSCNWSLRNEISSIGDNPETEGSAFFAGNTTYNTPGLLADPKLSTSGAIVSKYLTSHKQNFADSATTGGSCAVKQTSEISETSGAITNLLKSGCTYTSSDETVATAEGSTLNIHGAGFTILTGNDGSTSVIVVTSTPKQTVNILAKDTITYRMGGTCSGSNKCGDLSQQGKDEILIGLNLTTTEGATYELKSLDESIVTVKKATCSNTKLCFGQNLNANIYMFEIQGKLGAAQVEIKAPAVPGYAPVLDTLTIIYAKKLQDMHSKFKNQKLTFGQVVENALPDTAKYGGNVAVTYTYNGQPSTPYLTKSGTSIVAGTENAIVAITATAPETETITALEKTITVIIGDSSLAANKAEYYRYVEETPIISVKKANSFNVKPQTNGMLLQIQNSGLVHVDVYNATGRKLLSEKKHYAAGSHFIDLKSLRAGAYFVKIRQGSKLQNLHWIKE